MKNIQLTQGKMCTVDDADYAALSLHKWHVCTEYAARMTARTDRRQNRVWMHREIMNARDGVEVDHINGNGFDNRRCNLRLCTHAENVRNAVLRKDNTSGVKGVWWDKTSGKWKAQIQYHGKRISLGYFDAREQAAAVRAEASVKYHGEFARK